MDKLKQHIATINQANIQTALLVLLDKIEELSEQVLRLEAIVIEAMSGDPDHIEDDTADLDHIEDNTADQEKIMQDAFDRTADSPESEENVTKE